MYLSGTSFEDKNIKTLLWTVVLSTLISLPRKRRRYLSIYPFTDHRRRFDVQDSEGEYFESPWTILERWRWVNSSFGTFLEDQSKVLMNEEKLEERFSPNYGWYNRVHFGVISADRMAWMNCSSCSFANSFYKSTTFQITLK